MGRPRRRRRTGAQGRASRLEGGLRGAGASAHSGRRAPAALRAGGAASDAARAAARPMEAAWLLPLLLLLPVPRRGSAAEGATAATTAASALPARTAAAEEAPQAFEPARGEPAAVQPVVGISQRVKMRPNEKKDLGTLGYVLGVIMVVVLIGIGVGIVVGYLYKRGKDLKERQERKANEREMQRITLPLSAFSNPACELVEENVVVVHTHPTPAEEVQGGDAPLMGQAGTPGA